MENLNSNENRLLLFEIDENTVSEIAKEKNFQNITDVIVDLIINDHNNVHNIMKPILDTESFNLDQLKFKIIKDSRKEKIYEVSYHDIETKDEKIIGDIIIKMNYESYKGNMSNAVENSYCNSAVNPFLNKVYKLYNENSSEGELENLYNSTSEDIGKYREVNVHDNESLFMDPASTDDIIIEGLDEIDETKYIPYPNGPLNRPPVPFDLWRLIKDRKKGE